MRKRNFFLFCQKAQITSSTLNSCDIDTWIKATNFEQVDQEGNDDNALNRFEFIEILIRIAKDKYFEPRITESVAEAI